LERTKISRTWIPAFAGMTAFSLIPTQSPRGEGVSDGSILERSHFDFKKAPKRKESPLEPWILAPSGNSIS
jgi:hypothetical protein